MNADEAGRRVSYREKLWLFFKNRPMRWIDAVELEKEGGRQAWRTRVSDVRKWLEKNQAGTIENRVIHASWIERDEKGSPQRLCLAPSAVRSQYRYLPYRPLGRDAAEPIPALPLFDDGPWSR